MNPGRSRRVRTASLLLIPLLLLGLLGACSDGSTDGDGERPGSTEPEDGDGSSTIPEPTVEVEPIVGPTLPGSMSNVIPKPATVTRIPTVFAIRDDTVIALPDDLPEARDAADLLRESIRPAVGADLPIQPTPDGHTSIRFRAIEGAESMDLMEEGYSIEVGETEIVIEATDHDGYVWAVQTLRQLLAPEAAADEPAEGTFVVPGVRIDDVPRYPWRGSMLDITRHWFGPDDIRAHIDLLSLYKINRLHLHLSDDQAWRIEIRSRPELTEIASANEVGGGPGGFLTQDDYRDLVAYAAARGITIVPEIDTPGHTNAAILADPRLGCGGEPVTPYTGTQVGFSSLCTTDEYVYEWFDDVVREIAELTPGDWFHLGGDESHSTSDEDYRAFVTRAADIVRSHGKTPMGWDEIGTAEVGPDTVVQFWSQTSDSTIAAAEAGARVVLSPSARTYFDMKHTADGPGNRWAGIIDARTAYDWDPATLVEGLDERSILGVEAPLWTELISDLETIQQRVLPRIPALAEVGWTIQADRDFDDLARRLVNHARRWDAHGWAWTQDPTVPWS